MIQYAAGSFGFQVLFRLHGSAIVKSISPAILSSMIYIFLYYYFELREPNRRLLLHPYPMGALISALTFLLSFRANFAYNRYWEACTAVYQMHSKWIDVGMELTAFHLQSIKYESRKPPTYASYPDLEMIERERERHHEQSLDELQEQLNLEELRESIEQRKNIRSSIQSIFTRSNKKKQQQRRKSVRQNSRSKNDNPFGPPPLTKRNVKLIGQPGSSCMSHSEPSNWSHHGYDHRSNDAHGNQYNRNHSILYNHTWDKKEGPSPFIEEAAHLLSLLSAVSMSTLRNDLASAASPLTTFMPGQPFPHVDPDVYNADVRKEWTNAPWPVTVIKYLFGLSRSPKDRTLYNAARPFRVIGGVSDAEIELLQAARGPLAKVALCTMWLQEFISREYLAGSLGNMAPPIISRLYQFTSDGMLGYNQARKIAYMPFPFPHAQITSFFVMVVVGLLPVLMITFVSSEALAFILNLLTVMCFTGLHEVSRELESPFQNVPNDVPLNNFQGQYNEALMTMFNGYHPDAFWSIVSKKSKDPSHDNTVINETVLTTVNEEVVC